MAFLTSCIEKTHPLDQNIFDSRPKIQKYIDEKVKSCAASITKKSSGLQEKNSFFGNVFLFVVKRCLKSGLNQDGIINEVQEYEYLFKKVGRSILDYLCCSKRLKKMLETSQKADDTFIQNLIYRKENLENGFMISSVNHPDPSAIKSTSNIEFALMPGLLEKSESESQVKLFLFDKVEDGICRGICYWFLLVLKHLENGSLRVETDSFENNLLKVARSLEMGGPVPTMLLQVFPFAINNFSIDLNNYSLSIFNALSSQDRVINSIARLPLGIYLVKTGFKSGNKTSSHQMLLFKFQNCLYFFDPNNGLKFLPNGEFSDAFLLGHFLTILDGAEESFLSFTKVKVLKDESKTVKQKNTMITQQISPNIFLREFVYINSEDKKELRAELSSMAELQNIYNEKNSIFLGEGTVEIWNDM